MAFTAYTNQMRTQDPAAGLVKPLVLLLYGFQIVI